MKTKYKAFTLVEMLVVMGILIILIVLGVSVARFAMNRARDTHHKDAARNLHIMLLNYKNDHGKFPEVGATCPTCIPDQMFAYSLGYNGTPEQHILKPYMEEGAVFDGGTNATYYYGTDSFQQQVAVVCVSLGGVNDESRRGFYCTGTGLGTLPEDSPILKSDIGSVDSGDPYAFSVLNLDASDWKPKERGFWLSN